MARPRDRTQRRTVDAASAALLALAAAALAALGSAAAGSVAYSAPAAPGFGMLHLGPERLVISYPDAQGTVKGHLVARINRDRQLHGVPPLRYDARLALTGDRFTHDQALAASNGHWDPAGRPPYVRWGLAGGVDFHSQNAGSYSNSGGIVPDAIEAIALQIHESMMDERPPDDGHRQTILNPLLTHVGIGLAQVGGEFRITEEFSRVAFEWLEVPDRPLRPGTIAAFSGKPLAGLEVGVVEIAFEPPPRKLTTRELNSRGSYSYPRAYKTLYPKLRNGGFYRSGEAGEFDIRQDGAFSLQFRCDQGPGYYFVLCYVRKRGERNPQMFPATAAMVTVVANKG